MAESLSVLPVIFRGIFTYSFIQQIHTELLLSADIIEVWGYSTKGKVDKTLALTML